MDATHDVTPVFQRQLREWLATAELPDDGRLPPERKLAEQFGVNRTELRKALAVLEAEGRLWRRVGKGTFVKGPGSAVDCAGIHAIADRTTPLEAMQVRRLIEPELARLAAVNANRCQIAAMRALCAEIRAVTTWSAYREIDKRLHATIAEAAGNTLLYELHSIVNRVRCEVIWGRLDVRPVGPSADYHSFTEHDSIVDAIERRDRRGAAEAMIRHLEITHRTLMTD